MALKDIFHGKEKTESQVPPMKIFDNITEIVRDDLQKTIKKNGRVSVAAACFSMYAYQELKQQLDQVDEFRFIFTSPTFIKEKAEKQKREFYIPRLHRENSLYGTEFEIKLRNELTQRAIAKECANWIKAKAKFKSNTTGEHMGGFMTVASPSEQYAYAPINGFTTVDIGRERGNNSYNMVQGMEAPFATQYMQLFDTLWNDQNKMQDVTDIVIENISNELVNKAIAALDAKLHVPKIFFKVESGAMEQIKSKEDLLSGASFVREESAQYGTKVSASSNVKYDLIGKLVDETGLTRKAIVQILQGIKKPIFDQFKDNPEEFIIRAADIINDEKATAIIQHITYNALDEHYETDVFTEPTIKGKLGSNAMKAKKHLYDHIVYDSTNERDFAEQLDTNTDVAVYVKLPDGFYISTPVGRYNPDWAIAFYEGKVKHIYFVAETKGSMSSMQLRLVEESKIHCAREHFKAISSENVVYDVVDSYQALLDKVMK